ncbi:MAG TPA: proline dehydrogenase family protein [Streptosporangiaceae bacterium]|nr:proline dehydrogenase family protein [Streptosporangiaceae bacterium]
MAADRAILFRLATSERLERAVRRAPAGERLAWRAAARYVAGQDPAAAVQRARELAAAGIAASLDLFGELVRDTAVADRVAADYRELADRLTGLPAGTWLSVDMSHLGLDIDPAGGADRLATIAERLPEGRRVQVGAEDFGRADAVLTCVETVAARGLADRLGATAQANLHRTGPDLERMAAAGVHVRLVKGAYVEPADRALPYGEPTDLAFLRHAHWLAASGTPFALATHDGVLREALLLALGPTPVEQLLGVRPEVLGELVARPVPVRVYVPFGRAWFRYWMRRVAESRGA